jgi:hypothetical protein
MAKIEWFRELAISTTKTKRKLRQTFEKVSKMSSNLTKQSRIENRLKDQ